MGTDTLISVWILSNRNRAKFMEVASHSETMEISILLDL